MNDYIRSHFETIDYNSLLKNPQNSHLLNPAYEGKGNARDGIHPYNAYKLMREEQMKKMQSLSEISKNVPNTENPDVEAEIQNSIHDVQKSILAFRTQLQTVFVDNKAMTPEQKNQAEKIV